MPKYTNIFKKPVTKAEVEGATILVVRAGNVSPSMLQRSMKIGFAKAATIIGLLEDAGVVSSAQGAAPRFVILKQEAAAVNAALRQLKKGNG